MKKHPTSSKVSKSQGSQVPKRLKQSRDTPREEVPPAKRYEGTTNPDRENTTGLAILPDELLLEILSYYTDDEPELNEDIGIDADAHFACRERLIALSQTCRNLRRFLHPYVWRRIEVFSGMRISTGLVRTKQQLALELIRQLEIVTIRDPSLAQYVNIVNVMIGDHCVNNVGRELARCLPMFPNMHTFKVNHPKLSTPLDEAITRGFRIHKLEALPQVRSVAVPSDCESLLEYFPGARHVYIVDFPQSWFGSSDVSFLATHCPLMQNISLYIPSGLNLPFLLKKFPNIKDITLYLPSQLYGTAKTDLNFILTNFHCLSIIQLTQPARMLLDDYNWIKSQVINALLRLQERDHQKKILVLYDPFRNKKMITLPWPVLHSQSPNNLQV